MRATKGGQMGKNGEWYEGGQFLPSTELGKLPTRQQVKRVRKVQVEPYVWVESDRRPILSLVGTYAQYANRYDRNTNLIPFESNIGGGATVVSGKTVKDWCEMYNAGERWMD